MFKYDVMFLFFIFFFSETKENSEHEWNKSGKKDGVQYQWFYYDLLR